MVEWAGCRVDGSAQAEHGACSGLVAHGLQKCRSLGGEAPVRIDPATLLREFQGRGVCSAFAEARDEHRQQARMRLIHDFLQELG